MPDEVIVETPTEVVPDAVEPGEPSTPTEGAPHPLAPGGPRFEEVYRQMKEQERANQTLREEVAELRGRVTAQPAAQPQQQPRFFKPEELQALVDQGRITPMQATDQIAWQRQQEGMREIEQKQTLREKTTAASAEVAKFMDKIPGLTNTTSDEFRKVSRAAYEISDELGLPVSDPRVQRRALRETFGTLDRITDTRTAREFDRRAADTHTEVGRGAGGAEATKDPLKDVPAAQMEYWKRLGYSREQMLKEAPFVRTFRSRQR
jgi:hypothetical protein